MKISLLFIVIGMLATKCGSQKPAADWAEKLPVQDAYYIEEIGGTSESGIGHTYYIVPENWPDNVAVDSLHFEEVGVEAGLFKNGQVLARRYFAKNRNVPRGVLKATLRGHLGDEKFSLTLDSIYMKERIALP